MIMDFHPFLIHFPISFYFLAFLFEILRYKLNWINENTPLLIFIIASIFSIFSAFTGDAAKLNIGDSDKIIVLLENHEGMGTLVTIFGLIFSFFLLYMRLKYPKKKLSIIKRLIFLLMTLMVFYTGFLGGKIVHNFDITYINKLERYN
ncbi:MAG: hypothetical protein CMF96_01300 [Candidatus Marinimicrobia bacterium]|nr:hypothetical protein [Candidatus Neomarinimicrobiota bacterium]|tara:strand:- start:11848 stop:12291 length:444 start_codon:yes stop_codon:yes gene_type:complete